MSGKSSLDPALLDLFRAEIETHLPALSEGLLALEKDPNQPKRLEAMMRTAHSIKGAARIVGMETAVQVAHAMEDCFVAAQKGAITLTSDAVDELLGGVDALQRITLTDGGGADEGLTEESLRRWLGEIAVLRAGRPPAPGRLGRAEGARAERGRDGRATRADHSSQRRPRRGGGGGGAQSAGGGAGRRRTGSSVWISPPSARWDRAAWRCSHGPLAPPRAAGRRRPYSSSTPPPRSTRFCA